MAIKTTILILTKNAGKSFDLLLDRIFSQQYQDSFEVVIIDSGSRDTTFEIIKKYPVQLYKISPNSFGHGSTRNYGVSLSRGEMIVFLSQDALPSTNQWLKNLLSPFKNNQVIAVFGRQIACKNILPMEQFFISYNYPQYTVNREIEKNHVSIGNLIFSNANSAIRKKIIQQYPFNENISSCEDQEWAHRMIIDNRKIMYVSNAAVYHGHRLDLKALFMRNVDFCSNLREILDRKPHLFLRKSALYLILEIIFIIKSGNVYWLPYMLIYEIVRTFAFLVGSYQ